MGSFARICVGKNTNNGEKAVSTASQPALKDRTADADFQRPAPTFSAPVTIKNPSLHHIRHHHIRHQTLLILYELPRFPAFYFDKVQTGLQCADIYPLYLGCNQCHFQDLPQVVGDV